MRHTSILISILILILYSYDIKAQNGKLYDVEGLLLIEHIYENGVYKPLWHTKRGKAYPFGNTLFDNTTRLFSSEQAYEDFLKYNHSDTSLTFKGQYVVCFLISKKGKIIEDRIIRKTNGCEECDTLVLKTLKKIRKMKAYSFDNKANTVSKITIPFGRVWE